MTSPPTPPGYPDRDPQLFYELTRDRLAMQLESVDALDNKIGLLVSLASGLMGILAAVFALRAQPLDGWEITTIVVSTVVYLVVSALGIHAYFARRWKLGPDLLQVWEAHKTAVDDDLLKWKIARACWDFYEKNRPQQAIKEQALPCILVGVVIQSLLLVLALVLVAEGG